MQCGGSLMKGQPTNRYGSQYVTVKSDCCDSTLRVYQPPNHHSVIYCPGCESPYLVHCRNATPDDIDGGEA